MPAVLCIILVICTITYLVLASIEIYIMRHVTVIVIGVILIILLSIFNDCGDKNPHVQISGIGFTCFLSYFLCWLFGARGIIFNNYLFIMAVSSLFVFMVYFFVSLCKGKLVIVGECARIAWNVSASMELIILSVDNVYVRCFTVYLYGALLCVVLITNCNCIRKNIYYSTSLVYMTVLVCSSLCMYAGGDDFIIVQTLWLATTGLLIYFFGPVILIACCIWLYIHKE